MCAGESHGAVQLCTSVMRASSVFGGSAVSLYNLGVLVKVFARLLLSCTVMLWYNLQNLNKPTQLNFRTLFTDSIFSDCELIVYIKLHLLFFLGSPQDGSAPKSRLCLYLTLYQFF